MRAGAGVHAILELMIAMAIFTVICGLNRLRGFRSRNIRAKHNYRVLETRLAIDQIVRFQCLRLSGGQMFSKIPADSSQYALLPVAWDPNYAVTQCLVGTAGGGTCQTPGDFDLIVETDLGSGVSWVRYQLIGTTLYRAVVPKTAGGDPVNATSPASVKVPFLTNVMNNVMNTSSAGLLTPIIATYPSMFPGGAPQPIFKYTCNTPAWPTPCPSAGSDGVPGNIRDVDINLIAMTRQRTRKRRY